MSKLVVKNLYKVFGANPQKIIPMLNKNASKETILKETNHTVGLKNVNFEVNQGEIFVVMGLSGSGKSTLIRCLNRLIEPTIGEINVDNNDILKADKKSLLEIRRKKFAMVFQHFGLMSHRTVLSNVEYGLEIQNVAPQKRKTVSSEAIELVGLKGYEDSMPNELSGGMQQRVGLARALATDPEILLMDEAFSALDPLIRTEMQDELLDIQERMHKTIIFITHDLDEALKLGDRIAIMKDGEIVQIGSSEEILTNPANGYVKDFVKNVNRTKVITASSIMKKPNPVVKLKDGPKVAIHNMKKAGISNIFVTDKDKKLQGIVTIYEATNLVKENKSNFSEIIQKEINTVSPDKTIDQLLQMAIDTKIPIAVTNEENKLLGIIDRVSVISGILGEDI
jgi:glycine betaine/proline transport system ATP-binding protein